MDEWDTQQAQLDDADEEGAVLALAEGCAAFRAGVAADDDDVELVGVQTPAERAAESRRRAEAEGKVLEIDDDVEFLGTRQAEQRPVRRHLAEPPRRKSPPPRDTIRTFGGSTAKATRWFDPWLHSSWAIPTTCLQAQSKETCSTFLQAPNVPQETQH